jgi:hypothetical protein
MLLLLFWEKSVTSVVNCKNLPSVGYL